MSSGGVGGGGSGPSSGWSGNTSPPSSSGSAAQGRSKTGDGNQRRPHESSLGTMPNMESCPSSGNFAMNVVANFNPLPPPPPPPKSRTARGMVPSPPSSGNAPSVASSSSSLPRPPPPPPPPAAGTFSSSLPPPPQIATRPISTTSTASSSASTATSSSARLPPPPRPPPPPPPPPRPQLPIQNMNPTSPPSLADNLSPTNMEAESPNQEDPNSNQSEAAAMVAWDISPDPPSRLPLTTFATSNTSTPLQQQQQQQSTLPNDGTTPDHQGLSLLARRQTHIPILIVSTESAQRIAWRNGLHLGDMFQGIAHELHFGPSSLPPFRSAYKSLSLSQLNVQFIESSKLAPVPYSEAHAMLQAHAQILPQDGNIEQELVLLEDRVEELLQDPTDMDKKQGLDNVTKDAYQLTSSLDIPWLARYRQALDATTDGLPCDLIQCPPLVLLVCSTEEEVGSPISVLQELYTSPHDLPDAFRNGLFDPTKLRREVLVLHDAVHGSDSIDLTRLRSTLQSQFGPHANILRLNTVPPETARALAEQETTDLWKGNGTLGNRLGVNDRILLRRYFQTLVTSCLLPSLERRISELNTIVNERKKGVRNLVKSFWRKPKDDGNASGAAGGSMHNNPYGGGSNHNSNNGIGSDGTFDAAVMNVRYRHDAIESQTRLLADTLFLMQDYEAALSTYRLIRDDFKADKALTHYGNVQEMIGLCLYCMDPFLRSKEIFSCFESALLSYTRAAEEERIQILAGKDPSSRPPLAPHATRQATRLCLMLATASETLTQGRELEVADLLASASSHESSLGAAVLLEQSSAYYYESGMFRKYAFHMLMSGHMFRTAGQDHHAFRCFTSALYVYRHGQWPELDNHLKSALAAQLYSMGRMSAALLLYAKLVSRVGKVSIKSQQKFLQHLLEICTEHSKKALAGADRMAAPSNLPSIREREAVRNAQLERIVDVIRFTKNASRVLELPYLNLPYISDPSVRVWTHAEEHFFSSSGLDSTDTLVGPFGKPAVGKEETWKELELWTTAELNAMGSSERGLDEAATAALSKIKDPAHRRVIAQIDREKQNRNLLERSRRNGAKPKPIVRARGEPILCDFTIKNPLDIEIQLSQMQLVARLVDVNDNICTSQEAIQFKDAAENEKTQQEKSWTFTSTGEQEVFTLGNFCRIQEKNEKASKSATLNPFFVVTKKALELKGREQTTVSIGLTPLVDGDLEILGVRFRLSDKVWVYHPFDIPGPLLQDTQSNRANRVRGECLLLKSRIQGDMPCLTAELLRSDQTNGMSTDDKGPLLDGQISHWKIRLSNIGNAPASQISMKTSAPWIHILQDDDKDMSAEELEGRATTCCIGPMGTLMRLPLSGAGLKEMGLIYPGETVDIPIRIRTCGGGKQDFYVLYRYEPVDESDRPRWLRKMYEVPVFPSLELSSRIAASCMKGEEAILSVEITNNRTDRPVDLNVALDKLALTSRHYRLEALPGQFSTSEHVGNVLQIGWQERVSIHYRVVPLEQESELCMISECPFQDNAMSKNQECVKAKATDFLCLERAFESFQRSYKGHLADLLRAEMASDGDGAHPRSIASIRRANTDISSNDEKSEQKLPNHPTSIGRLCPREFSASRIHVVCNWRAVLGDTVIRGEHHVRNIAVRPRAKTIGCPVSATAFHPSTLLHDFTKGPAIVPVRVALRNQMLESPIQFSVSVEDLTRFELIGLEMLHVSLKANEEVTIPFDVLIPQSGCYNLQALKLTFRGEDQNEVNYLLQEQWLIQVSNSSESIAS